MRLAIVTPVVLQNQELLEVTLEAVRHFVTRHEATLYLMCNRLTVCSMDGLQAKVAENFLGPVRISYDSGTDRCVSESWNEGCKIAVADGVDYMAIIANDTRLKPDCLDHLVDYGERGTADIWSGIAYNGRKPIEGCAESDGSDFSCVMLRPQTLERHGWFDPNYRPAYFEDNDYYGRVVLGGGKCRVVHAAQFFHHGCLTYRKDPQVAEQVQKWLRKNGEYFTRKWGVPKPLNSAEEVLAHYFRNPFNDSGKALGWFPEVAG